MPTKTESTKHISIFLNNILTEDDYDDKACMEERLNDLRDVANQCGIVQDLRPNASKDGGVEVVYLTTMESARDIAATLREKNVSGNALSATIAEEVELGDSSTSSLSLSGLILENILTEDDREDDDANHAEVREEAELARLRVLEDQIVFFR